MSSRYRFLANNGNDPIAIEVTMAAPAGAKGVYTLERLTPAGDNSSAFNVFRTVFLLSGGNAANSVLLHMAANSMDGTGSVRLRVVQGGTVGNAAGGEASITGGTALGAEVMNPATHLFEPATLGDGNVLSIAIGAGATEMLAISTAY
jgi:hypothetical protein